MKNNIVQLSGFISEKIKYSHTNAGEDLYEGKLSVERKSGAVDILPILFTRAMLDMNGEPVEGEYIALTGKLRTNNKMIDGRSRLISYIAVENYATVDSNEPSKNEIFLDGTVCKKLELKKTAKGVPIATITLAVCRPSYKSDYIPCIFWGDYAMMIANYADIGTDLRLTGRFQSREYTKVEPNGEVVKKVAYEVAVSKLVLL